MTVVVRESLLTARRLRAGADAVEAAALSLASDVADAVTIHGAHGRLTALGKGISCGNRRCA
ncbi:hypothetical protein N8K70_16955 [Microbacterium betulae]|uniref:Uncharacterized protein n=1 Tax=Microbacterium betulae TaxID=2981139 RepID=A0AA97FH50_9MICO|nr:hypothetical protein [Microbacterium sp. AB]WOF23063.1 hypothetical protein N8K70_16955 [Microbacterium sp. AB]